MEKTNPVDFSAIAISAFIVTAIMIIFHLYLIDTWSNDHKFVLASILAIAGFLIVRRMRDKTRDHRLFYLIVGNVLLGVGTTILTVPLIKWITERWAKKAQVGAATMTRGNEECPDDCHAILRR